jgi:hypothetical protein
VTFLDPNAIALAAGLTVPPLIALYFLKLRREVRKVPSTLLWKRAVEDLHVNAPFQRLRKSLLLLLQLLVLLLAAVALGKPLWQRNETAETTLILLVDQSASMSVVEDGARTRLDLAKEQAMRVVDNMGDDSRAMVVAFCDRATVVSSFDGDKAALRRKIDSIEATQSTSSLSEAIALAEAYAQTIIIGGKEAGTDVAPESAAPPAAVYLFSDGRIEDARTIVPQKFDLTRMTVTRVGTRSDNVGIIAMETRRDYDRPSLVEVVAGVRNFGGAARTVDATLYVDGRNVDVQTVALEAGSTDEESDEPPLGSAKLVVFKNIEFEGAGVVEVVLQVDDAFPVDDRAWSILESPRRVKVLLVTDGNYFLENGLRILPVELTRWTPGEFEQAATDAIEDDERSVFDLVIFDRHSTARLPMGNYFFWGSVPKIEGGALGEVIDKEIIFNWDETHPLLRHVAVETIEVAQWHRLKLPSDAVSIIDGQTSPVLAYFTHNASQFLVSAFSLILADAGGEPRMNTDRGVSVDFVVFMQNAVQFLASSVAVTGKRSVTPGEPVTIPAAPKTREIRIARPDGETETVPTGGAQAVYYARTRHTGTYKLEPRLPGSEVFAVNLFNANESNIAPPKSLVLGAESQMPQLATIQATKPGWPYFLLAILVLLLLEWIVYNRRVFV